MGDRSGKASGDERERGYQASQPQTALYHHQHHEYGTFQGVAYYTQPPPQGPPQPHPAFGIPQPAPPPGSALLAAPYVYPHGYQTVPGHFYQLYGKEPSKGPLSSSINFGYTIAEGTPIRLPRLPCCGIGMGWFLFIAGFFLAFIPWYFGALVLLCERVDYREKPGLVACTIAAILATIAITFGVREDPHHPW
ncbi:Large ribosomal subunit protein eL20z-like protein [Drosera capensis]